jgi:hypothetical protein
MDEHRPDAAAGPADLPIEPVIGTLRAALRDGRRQNDARAARAAR